MAAQIGIDFGTTNTVVALSDRGNFPVLALGDPGMEQARLSMPTLVAWRGAELRIGWEALMVWDEPGWQLLRSPKRFLGTPAPKLPEGAPPIEEILYRFFRKLRDEVRACPHVEGEEIEAMIGVPANANSLQRLRTLEAARQAGFRVLGLLHEPTAAAIEFAHRNPALARGGRPHKVLVYDLGGGTFDVAVVRADPDGFEVVCSAGIEHLGGDDFDGAMGELVLEKLGLGLSDLSSNARHRLLMRCREAKEAIRPATRRWLVELAGLDGFDEEDALEVAVSASEYQERCLPLCERSIETMRAALDQARLRLDELDVLLLCGGGSQLGLLQRRLKGDFGARLKISPHPFAATAVGLAVHAEGHMRRPARQRFARHFGVWREAEGGARPIFDVIFSRDTRLPGPGEVLIEKRSYHPAHNIGHFRFEECAAVNEARRVPLGESTPWCEIRFPYDAALSERESLDGVPVERTDSVAHTMVEERYECDSQGLLTVRLLRSEPPLCRSYLLYGPERVPPIAPIKRTG